MLTGSGVISVLDVLQQSRRQPHAMGEDDDLPIVLHELSDVIDDVLEAAVVEAAHRIVDDDGVSSVSTRVQLGSKVSQRKRSLLPFAEEFVGGLLADTM